jgi:ribonucleoside-diphosphate reductase alpha chain
LDTWSKATKEQDITKSPYYLATSNDIDWESSVRLQGAAQKWVSHSISKTCNIPNNTTKEMVGKIYLEAYKQRCKGFTVYRDGCRTGVLVSNETPKTVDNTKRPKSLPCDVYHISVKGKQYFVLVGLKDGQPYEVFAGKNGFLDKKIKHGEILKNKRGFKAIFEDETELSPISAMCDEHEEAITRLVSTSLRYGANMHTIVEQLEKVNGDISSFSKSISRAIKRYIVDGTSVDEPCPECGKKLMRQSGCKQCTECSYSACT